MEVPENNKVSVEKSKLQSLFKTLISQIQHKLSHKMALTFD